MKKNVCTRLSVIMILGVELSLILIACSGETGSHSPADYIQRAATLIDHREFDKAKLVLDTIAVNTRKVFGVESAEYATVLGSIVDCLRLGKHFAEAESIAFVIIALPPMYELVGSKVHAYRRLGELYLELDEPDLAIEYFMKARSFASDNLRSTDTLVSNITLMISRVYYLDSRRDSAASFAEQYLSIRSYQPDYLDSEYLWTLLDLSIWNADDGRCAEAESALTRVLNEQTVNKPENARFLADANLLLGSCKTKSYEYETSLKYYDPAMVLARQAYQPNSPRLVPFLRWYGNALYKTGNLQLAETLYDELLIICYRDTLMSPQSLSKILLEKAEIATTLGKSAEAKTLRSTADSVLSYGEAD